MLPLAVQSTGLRKEMAKSKKVIMKDLTLHTGSKKHENKNTDLHDFSGFTQIFISILGICVNLRPILR